jgi:hypothetical protein
LAYQGTIIPVFIASPSDVADERQVVRDVINDWNYIHAARDKMVLMPIGWETHSSPELSGRPQGIVNERILKNCDVLIGIFWTRLGTPTGVAESGTVEEIQAHMEAGKPALVYFSEQPLPQKGFDVDQYKAVLDFKDWCHNRGLVGNFESVEDFRRKLTRDIPTFLRDSPWVKENIPNFEATAVDATKPKLSNDALELLSEATKDRGGHITATRHLGGANISTNSRSFFEGNNPRQEARWRGVLSDLENQGFIEGVGKKNGEIFRVTDAGYVAVESA